MKPIDAPIRRSVLITPGSRPERVAAAASLGCDSVVIDLEDGVAPAARPAARLEAARALQGIDFGNKERAVRVNAPGTADLDADLSALVPVLTLIDSVWLPKVESAEQVTVIAARLPAALPLVLSIETPRGLFHATEIAAAGANAHARSALFFGSGDYCMETGARPGVESLRTPRAMIVAAAAMYNLQAIDAAYFLNPKDVEATRADAALAREMGFDGKLVFHPAQIAPANTVFAPDAQEIARASHLVNAFEQARQRGEGTLIVDGVFLAIDTVRPLQRLLWMADKLKPSS